MIDQLEISLRHTISRREVIGRNQRVCLLAQDKAKMGRKKEDASLPLILLPDDSTTAYK